MSRLLCNASPQPVLAGLVRVIIERQGGSRSLAEFPQTSCSHWFSPQLSSSADRCALSAVGA